MGPLIFKLYVKYLESHINTKCHQYVDHTTLYTHCKPENLQSTVIDLQETITELEEWTKDANLILNPTKTKLMVLSTAQLSSFHSLEKGSVDIQINGNTLERVSTSKLLGCHVHQHLKWEDNVKSSASSCYSTLAMLRKLKNILPFNLRKNIVQALVLSRLYYHDVIYHSLPDYLQKRLQGYRKQPQAL